MAWRGLDKILIFLLLGVVDVHARGHTVELCRNIQLETEEPVALSASERKLACGDPGTPAWSQVPYEQAAYFLRSFLHDRGYHSASHRLVGGKLVVESGPLSLVREVQVDGAPFAIEPERYWKVYGRPLTPAALDDLTQWLKTQLGAAGYPCAEVDLRAGPETGVVAVTITDAHPITMPRIEADRIPGVHGEIQKRYYALREGDPYDAMKLDLASRRMVGDEVVLSTSFITQCAADGRSVQIEQRLVPGEPRLVAAGVGFDTEELGIVFGSWKHARLGEQASRLSVSARASFRRQEARLLFDWYYAPIVTRHFLRETLTVTREHERRYETRSYKLQAGPAWTRDAGDWFSELWAGAAFQQTATVRGVGPEMSRELLMEAALALRTHDFEYYAMAPRSGLSFGLELQRAKQGVASDISATRGALSGTALWTLFGLDPPVWVLGLRTELVATSLDPESDPEDLPPSMRNSLGGSRDLRGFGRKAIPPTDQGALTTAYLGAEARVNEVLPFKLQPIVFFDLGKIGEVGGDLDRELFWSPGAGINWQSPVGTVRATLAHGFIDGPRRDDWEHLSRWQLFLSYGEQF
jgi:translocation and assembly module TamA